MSSDEHPTEAPDFNDDAEVRSDDINPGQAGNAIALAMFDAKLSAMASANTARLGRKNMWLAHHWPEHYRERCVVLAGRHVCRRCAALYPLGVLVAILSWAGVAPWPETFDPAAIWILSIPATVAYCAEALGLIRYSSKVQVGTTLVAALAFGRALGYEFEQRWSPEFWGPICFFGLVWFLFTAAGMIIRRAQQNPSARQNPSRS